MLYDESSNAPPAPPPPPEPERAGKRSALDVSVAWIRDLGLASVIAILLVVFVYQPVKVEGTSMTPTLRDQERIFINKFTYRFGLGAIERGDTVVFWFPLDPSKSYIKRVVGLPGDRVRIDAGQVYVNGLALREEYVADPDHVSWPAGPEPMKDRVVPPGMYFVLGDNRVFSSDSRAWGFVPRANIYGKAVFAYWPLNEAGRVR